MTNHEAKFILRSYRADGSDATDPTFQDALAFADRDPGLRAWLEHERAVDQALRTKLEAALPAPRPPAELIAGINRRRQRQQGVRTAVWLAAAAIAILLTLAATPRVSSSTPDVRQLITFALNDTNPAHRGHVGSPALIGAAAAYPGPGGLRAAVAALPDLAALKAANCRTVTIGGREVLEFCFGSNDTFHVYIAPRGSFDTEGIDAVPLFTEQGRLAAATWTDARHVYTVVTDTGAAALRAVL